MTDLYKHYATYVSDEVHGGAPPVSHGEPTHFGVRIAGVQHSVPIHHVSRATLNRPVKTLTVVHAGEAVTQRLKGDTLYRLERRARRRRRLQLRKRRGWR